MGSFLKGNIRRGQRKKKKEIVNYREYKRILKVSFLIDKYDY